MASLPLRESAAEASAWSQANENNEVVGHHRGPDIGLEVVEPAPGAAGQAVVLQLSLRAGFALMPLPVTVLSHGLMDAPPQRPAEEMIKHDAGGTLQAANE